MIRIISAGDSVTTYHLHRILYFSLQPAFEIQIEF